MLMFTGVLSPIRAMLRSSQDATRGAAITAINPLAHGICELEKAGGLKRELFQQGYGPKCQESVGLPKLSDAEIRRIKDVLAAALPDLIALLSSHDVDVQQAAAEGLSALTWHNQQTTSQASLHGAVAALAAQLESQHPSVKAAVAHALVSFACIWRGKMTSAGVVPALVVQLKSVDKEVRAAAATAIGSMIGAQCEFSQEFLKAGALPALKIHMQQSRFSEANSSKVQQHSAL